MSGIDTEACRTREDWPSMGWGGRWEVTYDKKAEISRLLYAKPTLRKIRFSSKFSNPGSFNYMLLSKFFNLNLSSEKG